MGHYRISYLFQVPTELQVKKRTIGEVLAESHSKLIDPYDLLNTTRQGGSCLMLNPNFGPFGSVSSTQTARGSLGFYQTTNFHITFDLKTNRSARD